ncbi:MAG: hypothetical protein ACREVK_10775 [Gammaproteobacteria bacterium]
MAITDPCTRNSVEVPELSRYRFNRTLAIAVAIASVLEARPTRAEDDGLFCSATASNLFEACRSEADDGYFVAKAKCLNVSDPEEQQECRVEATTARKEDYQSCREQRDGRVDACGSLGEGPYDPDFHPEDFDHPQNPTNPNPYFPLTVGHTWEYVGGTELNTLEVLNETKLIDGVTCIVVRDQVFNDGDLVEDTDDWYAQAKDGNVWYCGEEVKHFESSEGDEPRLPELVSIDGSFKAGRDRDKPGIIFQAAPAPGQMYREEYSLGNAEDVTEVLSTSYAFGNDPDGLDQFVPQALADRMCSQGDCVVTKNFSLLEPGVLARKYYAGGIGFFLEVNPDTGEVLQLVDCSFDDRCKGLPTP